MIPAELADKTWDNTGLLLECPPNLASTSESTEPAKENIKVLMTIDLTKSVVEEALKNKASFIIAYHPFIFRGIKAVNLSNPQHDSLVKLIQAGISVYCPHTSIDAAEGGVNDWLADGISNNNEVKPRKPLTPNKVSPKGHENGGMGRFVQLKEPISMKTLVERVKSHLKLEHIQVALAPAHRGENLDKANISKISLCAGSGSTVFQEGEEYSEQTEVFFTGEMSHHEALFFVESGKSVIVCGHSNTERGYLPSLKKDLEPELKKSWDGEVEVIISETDKDPLEIV